MKRFLAVLGAGFVLGMMVAPESRQRLRARLRRFFRGPDRTPRTQRYQWRDPENRLALCERDIREKTLDKTLADSFPASDPPSSIPDPCEDSMIA